MAIYSKEIFVLYYPKKINHHGIEIFFNRMIIEIRHPSAHRERFQTIWLNDAFC